MPGISRYALPAGWLACLAVLVGLAVTSPAHAQGKKGKDADEASGDTVRITTIDGVELHGTFHASAAKSAPTVLILHALGEDSKKKGYQELAATLQQNFCVMTFDFRGHGQSKDIQPDLFWRQRENMVNVKGGPKSTSIDYKDFKSTYYPYLVNDIVAVKGFLDRKNDLGACNTSSFIVIGAETGATLGAVWLNSEWNLYRMQPPMMFGQGPQPASKPEGKDTIAAVWLSISPTLGQRQISLAGTLDVPARQNATAMVFIHGDEDTKGTTLAKALESAIKGKDKENKHKFTGKYPIKGGAKLAGQNLLQKSLGTDKLIDAYLKAVVEEKGNEWTEREFRKTQYAYRLPGVPTFNPLAFKQAKPAGENNFFFKDYNIYIMSK